MALKEEQKEFITKRVLELGSIRKVQNFYQKDDAVCQFALRIAKKLLKGK